MIVINKSMGTDLATTQYINKSNLSKVESERVTDLIREQSSFLDTNLKLVKLGNTP